MGTLNLAFYESSFLGAPGSVEGIFDALNSRQIIIGPIWFGNLAGETYGYWNDYQENIREEICKLSYIYKQVSFIFSERRDEPERVGIVASVEIRWPETDRSKSQYPCHYLKLTTHATAMFTQEKYDGTNNCARLLELAEILYQSYRPKFGWIERGLLSGYTTMEQIQNLEISHVYWANFFGPDYVEKYGREYFFGAPGWRCCLLADRGCMYVLSSNINRHKQGMKSLEEEVKSYFGISNVRKKNKPRKTSINREAKVSVGNLSENQLIDKIFDKLADHLFGKN